MENRLTNDQKLAISKAITRYKRASINKETIATILKSQFNITQEDIEFVEKYTILTCMKCKKIFETQILKTGSVASYCSPTCIVQDRISVAPNGCIELSFSSYNNTDGEVYNSRRAYYVSKGIDYMVGAKYKTTCRNKLCVSPDHSYKMADNSSQLMKKIGAPTVTESCHVAREIYALIGRDLFVTDEYKHTVIATLVSLMAEDITKRAYTRARTIAMLHNDFLAFIQPSPGGW